MVPRTAACLYIYMCVCVCACILTQYFCYNVCGDEIDKLEVGQIVSTRKFAQRTDGCKGCHFPFLFWGFWSSLCVCVFSIPYAVISHPFHFSVTFPLFSFHCRIYWWSWSKYLSHNLRSVGVVSPCALEHLPFGVRTATWRGIVVSGPNSHFYVRTITHSLTHTHRRSVVAVPPPIPISALPTTSQKPIYRSWKRNPHVCVSLSHTHIHTNAQIREHSSFDTVINTLRCPHNPRCIEFPKNWE